MRLKFDSGLDYQRDAIAAVIEVFAGQDMLLSNASLSKAVIPDPVSELSISNQLLLTDEQMLANVWKIQGRNGIKKTPSLQGREFSVEMETGTGKTYVYLRTIFELSSRYGLRKFVIVVPSVAIREGVMKTLAITKEHFQALYENEPFEHYVYDSRKLGLIRKFASNNIIQIMVINIQSFQRDLAAKDSATVPEATLNKRNVINREHDKTLGRKPIEFIQVTKPVVIIDEPQSVDNTAKAKNALANLQPLVTLRYSATHKNTYNLLYKLDPVRAYDLHLVKHIEVASVRAEVSSSYAHVKLLKIDNQKGIRAQVEMHKEARAGGGVKYSRLWVSQGDDFFVMSGSMEIYRHGYIVQNIDCTLEQEYIELNNGRRLKLGEETGANDIMQAQVQETIEQHLQKELAFADRGIKVLSLFFLDKVSNYRIYNADGSISLGKIGVWFEQAYKDLTTKPEYTRFAAEVLGHAIPMMHNGYFARDRVGQWQNSTDRGSRDDDDIYNLIMRDKERLLDPEESLRFIFSHSALGEGWDNPNVFQICTLNESVSGVKKRQEIGRGLRLPVNKNGERSHDKYVNRLTVIANESYEDFARALQNEFAEDFGLKFECLGRLSFAEIIRYNKDIGAHESELIWHNLLALGYINSDGDILDKFASDNPYFEFDINSEYADIKAQVIDIMNSYIFKPRIANANKRAQLNATQEDSMSREFKALWASIKRRTRYQMKFDTAKLIAKAARLIMQDVELKPAYVSIRRTKLDISVAGVIAADKGTGKRVANSEVGVLPDLLSYLQKETRLTRRTLFEILKKSAKLQRFSVNPQQFMGAVADKISVAMYSLIATGIQYEKTADHYWKMSCLELEKEEEEKLTWHINNFYRTQNNAKNLPNDVAAVEYVKDVAEIALARAKKVTETLDIKRQACWGVKLPRGFKIDTPIGIYRPNWVFVSQSNAKLYFINSYKLT